MPYVLPRTGELGPPARVVVTPAGVRYLDPAWDESWRDLDGALWEVRGGAPTGPPAYTAELHPARQREAMEGLLCAGCAGPADRGPDGMLWLLPLLGAGPDTRWEGVRTAIPPMCAACAEVAPTVCPVLGDGHVELRVWEAELIGVRGTLHPRPGEPGDPDPDALVLHDTPDLRFVVARQAVRELCRTTVVSLRAGAAPRSASSFPAVDADRASRRPAPVTSSCGRFWTPGPPVAHTWRAGTPPSQPGRRRGTWMHRRT
ncbi:hypothetical protein [Streptomyces sp. NPDC048410]|uniref:hypothetical protein n=1 Tax=Streptomyces sp. NPDC048410 TaxID=3365545 RepID=UPI003715F424